MPKFRQTIVLPKGGGACAGRAQSRVIDVPEGDPLPAFCTPVADDTPTSDWAFTDSDTAKVPEANNHTEE